MTAIALIIEDNPGDQKVLQTLLARAGVDHVACEGQEVLQTIGEIGVPDLVFLDLEMPGLNGFQVLRELQSDPNLAQVPVVAYTSHTSEMRVAREAGFHSFLGKPLNSAAFGEQVAQIIRGEPVWEVRE